VVGIPIIGALGRLRQEDHEFKTSVGYPSELKASLGYTARSKQTKKLNRNYLNAIIIYITIKG
jgi:hypothetical protein